MLQSASLQFIAVYLNSCYSLLPYYSLLCTWTHATVCFLTIHCCIPELMLQSASLVFTAVYLNSCNPLQSASLPFTAMYLSRHNSLQSAFLPFFAAHNIGSLLVLTQHKTVCFPMIHSLPKKWPLLYTKLQRQCDVMTSFDFRDWNLLLYYFSWCFYLENIKYLSHHPLTFHDISWLIKEPVNRQPLASIKLASRPKS